MKLMPVIYQGFTSMDRRFSSPMLPWIVAEVRRRDFNEKLSLGIENGILQAYNMDFELQFSHRVNQITRFSQADVDPCTFLYLMRDDTETLLYCYLFQAQKVKDVTDLYKQMKEQSHVTPTRSLSSAATLTSLCVDISPSSSNFFEVLYIGKIKVWQKKVPVTFIDDALEKFRVHELEKNKLKQLGGTGKLQGDSHRRGSLDSSENGSPDSPATTPTGPLLRSISYHSNILQKQKAGDKDIDVEKLQSIGAVTDEKNAKGEKHYNNVSGASSSSESEVSQRESSPQVKEFKSSVDMDDHNRTMVLQVDRTDLRLISPDRKVILLHKHHKDITTCVQGLRRSDHFGFICKDSPSEAPTFIGYIFKCESASIATDAVAAITQAFLSTEQRPRPVITSCEHCPMVWFHRLCTEVEHMSDKKTQAAILRKLEQLEPEEQMTILTKFRGAETDSVREQNEFLMMLLRAHCETKQGRHIHDTAENRSEFLNQYLGVGGTNVFSKAKKSLTNSFDQFLKRRSSINDFGSSLKNMSLPITNNLNKESSPSAIAAPISESSTSDKDSEGFRSRSSTIESQFEEKDNYLAVRNAKQVSVSPDRSITGSEKGAKSPMMDIFLKVGNSPKSSSMSDESSNKLDGGSWRQAIFKRVVTTKKDEIPEEPRKKKTKEDLRELWRKAIKQAILLVRMEKENERLKAEQEESAVKRIKLEYDEMKPNQREVMEVWEMLTTKEAHIKYDKPMLLQAIRQGVPRGKRGEVWQFLAEQHCLKSAPPDAHKYPHYNSSYEQLLRQLTSHQHAILIDLGRTFPNHSYFSSPLGPGQLALFNLLKAYSLLDPEVGYCQGLSFVAGVLLLHMEESKAFGLLRHLMFRRGIRNQYLPDMVGLQIKLYQLSRLLHDQIPELYNHLDFYEVAPTLYAAPWLLTMFASQFPLGFVTRVFDLVFLEGADVVFRVALALMSYHKEKILLCDSFEEIMNYFKGPLSNVDKPVLDKVMKQVYTTDIKKQLEEYKVEYQVLQEEMTSMQPQVENLHKIEAQNKLLAEQNKELMTKLDLALGNVQRLEKTRVLQQAHLNRLEMQSRGLDVTIATLGNFINNLIEEKVDIEIPDEVRRIMSQISLSERKKCEAKGQNNLLKMLQEKENRMMPPDRLMVKSLSTGKIALSPTLDTMARSNSLNTNSQIIMAPNLKNQAEKSPTGSTEKKSHFFSNSHSNILEQQRIHNSQNNLLPNRIDIKIHEFENNRKNSDTNLDKIDNTENVSPTHSIDSGVGTPSSPKMSDIHPLSNCDVNFTFSGTTELKNLKSLKHYQRNSSPDMLGNKS